MPTGAVAMTGCIISPRFGGGCRAGAQDSVATAKNDAVNHPTFNLMIITIPSSDPGIRIVDHSVQMNPGFAYASRYFGAEQAAEPPGAAPQYGPAGTRYTQPPGAHW